MSATTDVTLLKRAIMIHEFRDVVETRNLFSDVATKLVSKAKNIYSPFTSVSVAKNYTTNCRVPVGTSTVSKDELVLDRNVGNAITDCEEELSYANFNQTEMFRADLYASIVKKLNVNAVTDFVGKATVVVGTKDLSTKELVTEFLITIATVAGQQVGVKTSVDGATVKRAPLHGKAFLACGQDAYIAITKQIATILSQSSEKGISGDFVDTPYGVRIINLGTAADDAKRLIWGVAGVPVMGYRTDTIKVDMGEMIDQGTASGADIDIADTDPVIDKTWYMSAWVKAKNTIFSQTQALVSTQLMD